LIFDQLKGQNFPSYNNQPQVNNPNWASNNYGANNQNNWIAKNPNQLQANNPSWGANNQNPLQANNPSWGANNQNPLQANNPYGANAAFNQAPNYDTNNRNNWGGQNVYFGGNNVNQIQNCQSQINPCLNGGTCVSQGAFSYACKCSSFWTGSNCEIRKSWFEPIVFQSIRTAILIMSICFKQQIIIVTITIRLRATQGHNLAIRIVLVTMATNCTKSTHVLSNRAETRE
jgi:hypothetical protein